VYSGQPNETQKDMQTGAIMVKAIGQNDLWGSWPPKGISNRSTGKGMGNCKFQTELTMYFFPPRPEVKISFDNITTYDNGNYYAQVKGNGSAVVLQIEQDGSYDLWNRENQKYTKANGNVNFAALYRGTIGRITICGEYLDKNLDGENGNQNHTLIIWDILEYEGDYLLGKTVDERLTLLAAIYQTSSLTVNAKGQLERYKFILPIAANPNCFLVRTWMPANIFQKIWLEATPIPVYEGLVFKKINAPLEPGFSIVNNTGWQAKCRKVTKNYRF
jgi:hypothetical protein